SHTPINLLARWRHLHHTEAFRHLVGERVHALTTDGNPREPAKQGRGRLIRDFGGQVHHGLLHVTLQPPRTHVQHLVERRGPRTADPTTPLQVWSSAIF